MNLLDDAQRRRAQKLIMTIIWVSLLSGLALIYLFLGRGRLERPADVRESLVGLIALAPLGVSIVIRWLVLPRCNDPAKALPVFIVGLAAAEACGIIGIFLGGPHRDELVVLGVLGLAQFAPFLMPRLFVPSGSGLRAEQ